MRIGAVAAGVLGLAVVPYLLLGPRAYVLIHDNLDSELVYLRALVESGRAFDYRSGAALPGVMDGLPRSALRGGLNVTVVLFSLLNPFAAYVVNVAVVRLSAFVGMLLLLARYVDDEARYGVPHLLTAGLFALLPFYPIYGLTVAGQPLLFWAYGNILNRRDRLRDWLVVAAYPFYSALYLVGIFLVAVLLVHWAFRSARARAVEWRSLGPPALLAAGYLLVEWPMIHAAFLSTDWTSHRVEFAPWAFPHSAFGAALGLLSGHYHAATLPLAPIAAALVLGAPELVRAGRVRTAAALLAAVALIVLLHAWYIPLAHAAHASMPLLARVQLDRFYFFLPLLWFLLFAIALFALHRRGRLRVLVPVLLALEGVLILRSSPEVGGNLALLAGREIRPSFAEFYDPPLFTRIREHIGRPAREYRVVAVGLHPAILQYNGFYTLDGYQNNYPLAYKHRFRAVIAPELAKDPSLARYFDAWGSRCYVFSAELGTESLWRKDSGKVIRSLAIDTGALRAMGGRYVVAAVPILNARDLGLAPRGTFEHPRSFWRLYLYELR